MTWLDDAKTVTTESRQQEYGHPAINFIRIALLWSVQQERLFTPYDVAMMMDLTKTARDMQVFKVDNMVDKIGYVSCIDRILNWAIERGDATTQEEAAAWARGLTVPIMWEILLEEKGSRESEYKITFGEVGIYGAAWSAPGPVTSEERGMSVQELLDEIVRQTGLTRSELKPHGVKIHPSGSGANKLTQWIADDDPAYAPTEG